MSAPEEKLGDRLLFVVFVNLEILGSQIAYVISFFVGDHRIDKHEPRFFFDRCWGRLRLSGCGFLGRRPLVPGRLVPEVTLAPPKRAVPPERARSVMPNPKDANFLV